METITLKLDLRSKAGRLLSEIIARFSNDKGVTIVDQETPYNPDFVKKVLERAESAKKGNTVVVDPNNVWESLGLKYYSKSQVIS
jgi:hypothetical protein